MFRNCCTDDMPLCLPSQGVIQGLAGLMREWVGRVGLAGTRSLREE